MGPIQSPMARTPDMGGPLWVTLVKIKIKIAKIKHAPHGLSFCFTLKHIRLICQEKI